MFAICCSYIRHTGLDIKALTLVVELVDIALRKLVAARRRNDLHFHAIALLCKHVQRSGAYPAVYQKDILLHRSDLHLHK